MICGYAGAQAGFSANLMIAGTDSLLQGITNTALNGFLGEGKYAVDVTCNWIFMFASTFLCAAVIGLSAWMMTAGNETMEDLTSSDVSLNNRRVETVLITPDVQAPALEVMAVPSEAPAPVQPVLREEQEAETVPVWHESGAQEETFWPVEGELERLHDVDHLHYDVTLRDWRTHEGIDILAPLGETVHAAMAGVVRSVEDDGLYGTVVSVDHGDGSIAVYANLAAIPAVNVGDWVGVGDVIGAIGTTALCEVGQPAHLHFAVYQDGCCVDPLNYLPD